MDASIALAEENAALKAELAVARAKSSHDDALIAHQKLRIALLERQVYGQKSERSQRLVEQLALAFEEAKADVPTAPEVVAPAPAPLPEVAPPVKTKPVVHHKTKKLTAKPRRDASHDPNGTVDPYL